MNDIDAIPYFPVRIESDRDVWVIRNPTSGTEYELTQSMYYLLSLCDGYRNWGEILDELERIHDSRRTQIEKASEPLLQLLQREGILWWRRKRLHVRRVPPPTAILWEMTNRCNLSCRHCGASAGAPKQEELSLEECLRLVDDLAAFGAKCLILSGGEPLTHPEFFKIAKHAANHGFEIQVATNATLITKSMAGRI
ncbi:MAG: radical SAM protein, partial [Candidatus Thorarchaeota archaeon]